jgi:hypothetical protein
MDLTRENTRSLAAEVIVRVKTMRAALAHDGMVGLLAFHHWSKPSEYTP